MPYYTYILFSEKLQRFYIGTTDDVQRRLGEHNTGLYPGAFTTKGIPWQLFLSIECNSSKAAYALDKYIKQMKSSNFIQKLKAEPALVITILNKLQ